MAGPASPEIADVLREVRRIDILARRLVTGVMSGGYRSVFTGSGLEFETVREYAEGDPQRAVDWNVTARMGRPYVKTYVDERELTVLFLLDLSASMEGGFGPWSARQLAARLLACLAFSAVRNGDKVGLIAFSDEVETTVRPRKGHHQALRLVRDCLALPARHRRTDPSPALDLATRAVRRHAVVFLLSDFLAVGWDRALRACARRHDLIAVRLLVPELEPPGHGLFRIRDPETGRARLVDAGLGSARRAFGERVAAWKRDTERRLRAAHVDLVDAPVPRRLEEASVSGPILRFFRMREQRGVKR